MTVARGCGVRTRDGFHERRPSPSRALRRDRVLVADVGPFNVQGVLGRIFFWASLVLLATSHLGCSVAAQRDDGGAATQAIVGGRSVPKARAAVGYLVAAGEAYPTCTATLVDPKYVITAAHCLVDSPRSLSFGTGAFRAWGPSLTRVVGCSIHPRYSDSDVGRVHDVAYCELAKNLATEPLALEASPAFDASYVALGYGQTDADDPSSSGPRKQLIVHRVDADEEPLLEGAEDMLGVTSASGNTCFGDSGGPLLVLGDDGEARVAGVLHGGFSYADDSDCEAGAVSVYAPVADNLSFLRRRRP